MENREFVEPIDNPGIIRRIGHGAIDLLKLAGHQLATSDQNPYEARLRAAGKPVEQMDIPDYPPTHDDLI